MKLRFLLSSLFTAALTLSSPGAPPKLIVAIVVDQLRYDYLERFHDQFTEDGFRMLTDRGAFLTFAHYEHVPTATGPGHATALSGTPLVKLLTDERQVAQPTAASKATGE